MGTPLRLTGLSDCGHGYLRECPLTMADWEIVFYALLGFMTTCRAVSERAHARLEAKHP